MVGCPWWQCYILNLKVKMITAKLGPIYISHKAAVPIEKLGN